MAIQVEKRREALRLRKEERLSLSEIKERTGISKGTLSVLLREIPLTEQERKWRWREKVSRSSASLPTIHKANRPPGNTKNTGTMSELAVAKRLVQLGYPVFTELGDNARYDLVWDRDGELLKVQVKTARLVAGGRSLSFCTTSSQTHRGRGKQDYLGQIDYFAAYSPELDKVFMVPVDEASPGGECSLRIYPPFRVKSRLASAYEL